MAKQRMKYGASYNIPWKKASLLTLLHYTHLQIYLTNQIVEQCLITLCRLHNDFVCIDLMASGFD